MKKRKPAQSIEPIERGQTKYIAALVNATLYNRLAEVHNKRRAMVNDGFAGTIRQLLYLGIEQYWINETAGRTTQAKRKAYTAKQEAEAQAIAAERERRKQGKSVLPAATPALFGEDG